MGKWKNEVNKAIEFQQNENPVIDIEKTSEFRVEIADLIQRLRNNIVRCNPLELLSLATYEIILKSWGTESEIDVEWDEFKGC